MAWLPFCILFYTQYSVVTHEHPLAGVLIADQWCAERRLSDTVDSPVYYYNPLIAFKRATALDIK